MTNNQHRLKNYIKQVRGISYKPHQIVDEPKEGYIPLLRATNIINDELDLDNVLYVEESLVKDEQLLREGDILIAASSGSLSAIGKSASFNNSGKFTFGAFCKVARPININPNYLEHYFKTSVFRQTVQNQINGANIKNIKNEHLDNLTIFVPNSNLQVQVVNLLNTVKNLINKRQSQITALYELTKSLFLEMFGDPVQNSLKWKSKKLEDVIERGSSISYGIVQTGDDLDEGIPVIRPVDFKDAIVIKELKKTSPEISNAYSRTILKGNELLITVRANIGSVMLASPEMKGMNVTRGITPLRVNEKIINRLYAMHLFKNIYMQRHLKELSKGITLIQLNMSDLREIPIILPPIEKQLDFASKIDIIQKQRELLSISLTEMSDLFNSLLQRAFKGELFTEQ